MSYGCKTRTDAFLRVLDARKASNVNPTEVYLRELRKRLGEWIMRIDEDLALMEKRKEKEVSYHDHAAE